MAVLPQFIPACPRGVLPPSMPFHNCLVNWANISRVVFHKIEGLNPFPALIPGEQVLAVELELNWTVAIGAADPDNIVLTPKTQAVNLVAGDHQLDEQEDQSIVWTGDVALSVMELQFKGLASELEEQLNQLQGEGLEIGFILKDGSYLGLDVFPGILPEGGDQPAFFPCELVTFSGRNNETGATADSNMMVLYFKKENIMQWRIYDTNDFGLVI